MTSLYHLTDSVGLGSGRGFTARFWPGVFRGCDHSFGQGLSSEDWAGLGRAVCLQAPSRDSWWGLSLSQGSLQCPHQGAVGFPTARGREVLATPVWRTQDQQANPFVFWKNVTQNLCVAHMPGDPLESDRSVFLYRPASSASSSPV